MTGSLWKSFMMCEIIHLGVLSMNHLSATKYPLSHL